MVGTSHRSTAVELYLRRVATELTLTDDFLLSERYLILRVMDGCTFKSIPFLSLFILNHILLQLDPVGSAPVIPTKHHLQHSLQLR